MHITISVYWTATEKRNNTQRNNLQLREAQKKDNCVCNSQHKFGGRFLISQLGHPSHQSRYIVFISISLTNHRPNSSFFSGTKVRLSLTQKSPPVAQRLNWGTITSSNCRCQAILENVGIQLLQICPPLFIKNWWT